MYLKDGRWFSGLPEELKEEVSMEVSEKEKITEAMKLCESKLQSFFSYLDDTLDKTEASKFKDFIISRTFFAGGVFRSVLSGTPVNDIDVFFKSQDDVLEFKHMVMKQPQKLFKEVTANGSYNWKPGKGPKVSFTTKNYGHPADVISRFDLSFNQHYYDMQKMEMKFDKDTFLKAGVLNSNCTDKCGSVARTIRFMNQGWQVDQTSILELLKAYWDKDNPFSLGSSGQVSAEKLNLSRKYYTEKDYFSRPQEKKAKSKTTPVDYNWRDPLRSATLAEVLAGSVDVTPPTPITDEPEEDGDDF